MPHHETPLPAYQDKTPTYLQLRHLRYSKGMTALYLTPALLPRTRELTEAHLPAGMLGIVCDETTYALAAETIFNQFLPDRTILVSLGKRVKATIETAERLRKQVARCDALLAVGSGTINDLTKYVAFRLDLPYGVFATAPSMNGYVSPTASLALGKQKTSVKATAPALLIGDLDVLAAAPLELIRAGIGDTLCRSSIEADLMLAEAFDMGSYDASLFTRLRAQEAELLGWDVELYRRDTRLVLQLMEALIEGGQMMQRAASSAPCSQSEHMIAHCYEMIYGDSGSRVLHGQAIAVTTLTMTHLQQKMIRRTPRFRPLPADLDKFRRLFGHTMCEALHAHYQPKVMSAQRCEQLNDEMKQRWRDLRERIEPVVVKALQLETYFKAHGCATKHNHLKWHKDRYEHAVSQAYLTRDRFTFLDIAAMDVTLRAEI